MPYNITLKPTNVSFDADSNETVLDSALQNNIHLEHSCKNGDCGVCTATIVSGCVQIECGESRDSGEFLTCTSKPLDNLEIEVQYFPELSNIQKRNIPVKIDSCNLVANDVLKLLFRVPPNLKLNYLPGQYVDLSYKEVVRSYSIANAKLENGMIELHVRYVPNGKMSALLFNNLQKNTLMRLYGPHGTFFVRDDSAPIIFLAGGTGYAPIKAMVQGLLKENCQRDIYIYWGVASVDGLYCNAPEVWSNEHENIRYIPVVSGNTKTWKGRVGLVHKAVASDFGDLSEFHVYACGSPVMIDAAKQSFLQKGLKKDRFYSDAFTAAKS